MEGGQDFQIPIDQFYTEGDDEAYSLSSERTLASTITRYRYENGRRYHAYRDGEYFQPNDQRANNHEGILHHLSLLTLNDKLFLAPVEAPKRVLDLGTGTGAWAIDVADMFSDAEVIGTDLSPIQADVAPPNVRFEIDDCTSDWIYPSNHFDLIHIRYLFGSISDWPRLYRQCFEHLEPGGYLEQLEVCVPFTSDDPQTLSTLLSDPDNVFARWTKNTFLVAERNGKTFRVAETMADSMRAAGFVDIVEKRWKWPLGPWSSDPTLKELGRWNLLNWEDGMEGWVMALFTRYLGWTYEQVMSFLAEFKRTLRDRRYHVYHEMRLVYGRKP